MDYQNPIDQMIQRFQHRWETDRQYRAAMSGVFGLLLIVVLCGGVGMLDLTANRVLAAVGFQVPGTSGGNSAQHNTDTGVVVGDVRQYPTATMAGWSSQATPAAATFPASGTPFPTPTPTVTPTDVPTSGPCTSNCGGGGGKPAGQISATWSPGTWASGQQGAAFTVHATDNNGNPKSGVGIAVIYSWKGGTWLDEPPHGGGFTDSNGNYTSHPSVGNCLAGGDTAYVQAGFPGYATEVTNTWLIPCS